MKKLTLRPYQTLDTSSLLKSFDKYNSILYQLPTGGGKTVIIQEIVDKILTDQVKNVGKKILILVHRREIIFQIRDRLTAQGVKVGVLIGAHEENIDSDILVGSILTVARDGRLDDIMNRNFDFMIIDEAHHARSNSYTKVIIRFKEHNPNYKLLGVTATPYRKDKKGLGKVFEALIIGPSISELQEQGYLCKAITYATNLEELNEDVSHTGGDYNITELSKFMRQDHIVEYAIQSYKDKGNGKQMLVFCADQAHALQVKKSYIEAGYTKIDHIDSKTNKDKRDKIISEYGKGKLQIITSIQTLTEGVDLPETGVIQFLRPTLSLVLYLQMGGRGLRPKKDGSELVILDIANCSREHGLLGMDREWNLDNSDPNIKRKKNKIVGFREDGTMVENASEIESEGLELVELSAEEYFMRNQNGIQEAEQINLDLKAKMFDKYEEVVKFFNDNIKIPNLKFTTYQQKDKMLLSSYGWDTINVNLSGSSLANIKLPSNTHMGLGHTFSSYSNYEDILKYYKALGKISEKMSNKSFSTKVLNLWNQVEEIRGGMVNVDKIRSNIKEFKRNQVEVKINEMISKGIFELDFGKEMYLGRYNRNFYRYCTKLIFKDSPKKLRGTNHVAFYTGESHYKTTKSFKKEDIISLYIDSQHDKN